MAKRKKDVPMEITEEMIKALEETPRKRRTAEEKEDTETTTEEPREEPVEEHKEPIMFRVNHPGRLRIRAGISMTAAVVGFCGEDTVEIEEIIEAPGADTGWGKLADGRGYINLDFARRI